ncbi:MAG: M23 family metallopeptidase [Oligoflexia bacterium]|nr:M23 family metallopeptidase [Oligoflexia bacterium]MBF0367334.1 M23 family metallopeptidase [Oligoflexia bacterium]
MRSYSPSSGISLLLLLLLLQVVSGCSQSVMRSGRYVLLAAGENAKSLAALYGVPKASIESANRQAKWSEGEWIFVPEYTGILSYVYGNASLYGWSTLGAEDFRGGLFLWPVPSSYRLTSAYGEDRSSHNHAGIDVAAPMGDDIVAVADGVVSFSGSDPGGYGEVLMINHGDGTITVYGHLLKKRVSQGDRVNRGDAIALVGNSGRSTGPHLHFEVRQEGKSVDPFQYLKGQ